MSTVSLYLEYTPAGVLEEIGIIATEWSNSAATNIPNDIQPWAASKIWHQWLCSTLCKTHPTLLVESCLKQGVPAVASSNFRESPRDIIVIID